MKNLYIYLFFLYPFFLNAQYSNDNLNKNKSIPYFYKSNFIKIVNYPNPLTTKGVLEFYLPKKERIRITITNILGKKIRTITNKKYSKGRHKLSWLTKDNNNANLKKGIYFINLSTSKQKRSIKIFIKEE